MEINMIEPCIHLLRPLSVDDRIRGVLIPPCKDGVIDAVNVDCSALEEYCKLRYRKRGLTVTNALLITHIDPRKQSVTYWVLVCVRKDEATSHYCPESPQESYHHRARHATFDPEFTEVLYEWWPILITRRRRRALVWFPDLD